MIIVHGTIPILSIHRDKALELARKMVDATRQEKGCISYDFYVGLSDPNTLMLFQEWENMESLMNHFQTSHMEHFLRELPNVVSGDIITRRYSVESLDDSPEAEPEELPIVH
ncbi:MAG: hypothetical protein CMD74_01690 [Gammaproteobacteria bacterium]|nr:hypothetical protein [Gammaproteobacteria bacterium]|tara:strand:+ start:211 stop:546 length:336 start_codon:yes stop_codon:yes gene_type:complete